ncbi:hypothetical protein [Clostridium sp.]|uniref:hypothetical protein n=1 Tax=Clostridium sp. TaxID=1506 RepID=UPI0039F503E7
MNKAFAATDTRVDKLKYKFTSITSTSFTMDVTEDSDTANQFNGNVHYLVWDNGNGKYGTLEDVVAKLETDSKDTIKYPELAELNGKSQDQCRRGSYFKSARI